jgi:hypothetical protein
MSDGTETMLTHEAVIWAVRLFLGREPRNSDEIELHRHHNNLESLRVAFGQTHEVRNFVASVANEKPPEEYRAPLFLLEPPQDSDLPWRFSLPSLETPVTQLCTQSQLASNTYENWCTALGLTPNPHRKTWEFCYITAVMASAGLLKPGVRAVGFGVGQEPLPAYFASCGLDVLATDAPPSIVANQGWASTNEYSESIATLDRPAIIPFEELKRRVGFDYADMNDIPAHIRDFDVCWSACALEHLGSLEHGLRFIERSLDTLRPGGIAIHTTEFNLDSNAETFEHADLCFFRKQDIEKLWQRLSAAGHIVSPLNFHPGFGTMDRYIDLPPYSLPHLKIQVLGTTTTSIGLMVQKRL